MVRKKTHTEGSQDTPVKVNPEKLSGAEKTTGNKLTLKDGTVVDLSTAKLQEITVKM